jgi:hypothetical protein
MFSDPVGACQVCNLATTQALSFGSTQHDLDILLLSPWTGCLPSCKLIRQRVLSTIPPALCSFEDQLSVRIHTRMQGQVPRERHVEMATNAFLEHRDWRGESFKPASVHLKWIRIASRRLAVPKWSRFASASKQRES